MIQIRNNVFETNSSSTHSITMCSKETFEAWKKGELLFHYWKEKFENSDKLREDIVDEAKQDYESNKNPFMKEWDDLNEEAKTKWIDDYIHDHTDYNSDYRTYGQFMNDYELDTFISFYTTEGGEEIVAFGKYGYDG